MCGCTLDVLAKPPVEVSGKYFTIQDAQSVEGSISVGYEELWDQVPSIAVLNTNMFARLASRFFVLNGGNATAKLILFYFF